MDKIDWFPLMLLGVFIPISLGFMIPSAIEIDIRSQEISAEIQQLEDEIHEEQHKIIVMCAMTETVKMIINNELPTNDPVEYVFRECLE